MNNKIVIKTYKELESYFEMFREQHCDLLIVVSKGGLGKTTLLKNIMKNTPFVYINTHSTPLQTYKTLFENQDAPVCMDDLDAILKNNIMVSLLKSLADTRPIKEIHYSTTSKLIGDAPSSFNTGSNVCLILNEFDVNNKALEPILDRGFFIEFIPTRDEVLKKISYIMRSQSLTESEKCVYDFLKDNYKKIDNFSIRTYKKAQQIYRFDPSTWKEKFMQMIGFNEKVIEYMKIKERYPDSVKKQEEEFIKVMRNKYNIGSRATFFRVKQDVEDN